MSKEKGQDPLTQVTAAAAVLFAAASGTDAPGVVEEVKKVAQTAQGNPIKNGPNIPDSPRSNNPNRPTR